MQTIAKSKEDFTLEMNLLRKKVHELENKLAEAQLYKIEIDQLKERYYILSNSSFEAVVIHENGKILEVNKNFCEMFGYSIEEVVGKSALELAAPESRQLVMQNIINKYEKPYEATGLRKNGTTFRGILCGKTITYQDKVARVTIIQDISAIKETQTGNIRWENIFKNSDLALGLGSIEGTIVAVNLPFAKMHGYTPDELKSKPISSLFPTEIRHEVPGIVKRVNEKGHLIFESKHIKKDGTVFPVMIDALAVKDDHGKLLYRIVYIQDITLQKKQENELKEAINSLRENEAQYRSLVETAHDMVQSIDPNGNFIYANKAWVDTMGYKDTDIKHIKMQDIIHPDFLTHCMKIFKKVLQGQTVRNIEVKFLTKNNKVIDVEGYINPKTVNEKTVATQGIFRDVTIRNQLAKELINEKNNRITDIINAQEKERQRIGVELHDSLGQILTAVSLKIEEFKGNSLFKNSKASKMLNNIQKLTNEAINETINIYNDLIPSILHDFGLVTALRQLCKNVEKTSHIKTHLNVRHYTSKLPEKLKLCLYRVVQEGLNNISKHSQASELEVQLFNSESSLFLIIEDNGKGFIYKNKKSDTITFGLTNIQERVREFGGKVNINSAINKGTEIIIEIPLLNTKRQVLK